MESISKALILAGIGLALFGVLLYVSSKFGYFGLGRLPGDIRIDRENFSFSFPITTCILISIILSALLYLLSRFRG
ncbi:MAG: DUF2905 domain-containing protein [Candidatus Hydrogenedentes bacterium]|nr:DUF2905 domain-containing protein [Candidatus Hydrogenedentota bacterium]